MHSTIHRITEGRSYGSILFIRLQLSLSGVYIPLVQWDPMLILSSSLPRRLVILNEMHPPIPLCRREHAPPLEGLQAKSGQLAAEREECPCVLSPLYCYLYLETVFDCVRLLGRRTAIDISWARMVNLVLDTRPLDDDLSGTYTVQRCAVKPGLSQR